MYACILETGRGCFEGVHALNDQDWISTDPPPPRIALHLSELLDPNAAKKLYCYTYLRYE